jgi:site-specific recombinase XerD
MEDITLKKALDDYQSVYMAYRNFAERTREEYINDLEDLIEFLEKNGVNKVGRLGLAQVERYLAELEKRGFVGATRKRKTVAIRSFLKFLYQDQYISSNIAKHIIPPFVDNKTPMYLSEVEYSRLRTACAGNKRDAAIVELFLQTGIRLSELTNLTLDDIELQDEEGSVRIRGSRRKGERILPLNSKASQALNAYLGQRNNTDSSFLFLNRFGKPIGDRGVQKMLSKYLEKSGLERANVHTLRHTFGAHYAVNRAGGETLQKVMGYKDRRSTSMYFSAAQEIRKKELEENAL